MKSYKQLKQDIIEHSGGLSIPAVDGGEDMFDIVNPQVMNRINASLAYVNEAPTNDMKTRIQEIKAVLMQSGLDFDASEITISESEGGYQEIPLNQFGGRIGMTPEEGWVNDDGISHKLAGGLSLKLGLDVDEGRLMVDATVIHNEMSESFYNQGSPINENLPT